MEAAEEAGVTVVVEARRRAEAVAVLEVVVAEEVALTAAGEAHTEARTLKHFRLHTARPKTGAGFFLCLRYLQDYFFARPLLLTTLGRYRCLQE
jgi:hypothetical protein